MKFILISFLQATQRNVLAVVTSVGTELLPLPIFAAIFHYTGDKKDPVRIFYSYICNDCFSIIVCCIASFPSMFRFYKQSKINNEEDEEIEFDESEAIPEL